MHSARGQSEVLGSVLLVAVIVVAVSSIGVIAFTGMLSEAEPVSAVVEPAVTPESIAFRHGGGDPLAPSDLEVVARSNSSLQRVPFENGTTSGEADRFEPGDRWVHPHSFGDDERVRLILIHEPTNAVLFDGVRATS